jgi:hypothetical protein
VEIWGKEDLSLALLYWYVLAWRYEETPLRVTCKGPFVPSNIVANLHQWEIMSWHDMRCQKACKNVWRAFLICNHTIWWFCVVLPQHLVHIHNNGDFD